MRICISAFILASLLCPVVSRAQTPEERTRQALNLVLQRKYEAFYAQFSLEMKKAISLKDYAGQGDQILAALGKPANIGAAESHSVPNGITVTNKSDKEPLVILKHFGPRNPDADGLLSQRHP